MRSNHDVNSNGLHKKVSKKLALVIHIRRVYRKCGCHADYTKNTEGQHIHLLENNKTEFRSSPEKADKISHELTAYMGMVIIYDNVSEINYRV